MKLYMSEHQAALNEGIIHGVDDTLYASIEESEADFPKDGVLAYWEGDKIRVAWTARMKEEETCQ